MDPVTWTPTWWQTLATLLAMSSPFPSFPTESLETTWLSEDPCSLNGWAEAQRADGSWPI